MIINPLNPTSLSHPSQGSVNYTCWVLRALIRALKTAQNTSYITALSLSCFLMVKIMMHCPKSIFKPTLPNRSMSFNLMDN